MRTPSTACGILNGITRQLVIELPSERLLLQEGAWQAHDLLEADEAFLTGTTKGILPISQVDGQQLTTGPGAADVPPDPRLSPVCRGLAETLRSQLAVGVKRLIRAVATRRGCCRSGHGVGKIGGHVVDGVPTV